jgi:hypothetical protein
MADVSFSKMIDYLDSNYRTHRQARTEIDSNLAQFHMLDLLCMQRCSRANVLIFDFSDFSDAFYARLQHATLKHLIPKARTMMREKSSVANGLVIRAHP